MNQQIINIKSSGPTPTPAIVKPGYEILFQMDGWTAEVDIDFGTKSPFTNQITQFGLNGSVTALAKKSYTVAETADGQYSFSITIKPSLKDPEPPTVPSGDIEVSRDTSPPDDKKK